MSRFPRPHRTFVAACFPLLVALSSCATVIPSALTVEGKSISKDELENDLKSFEKALLGTKTGDERKQLSDRIHTAADGGKAWNPQYVAFVAGNRMQDLAVGHLYAKSGLPKPTLTKEIRSAVEQNFDGPESFKLLPKKTQDRLLATPAQFEALLAQRTKAYGTDDKFFTSHPEFFVREACSKHILVATEAEALSIAGQLAKGADFGKIAKTKSTDPGSGAQGGDLGCGDPGQFVPPFAKTVRTAKLNALSKPVQTQFGYHLIMVTSRKSVPLEEAKAGMVELKSQAASADIQADLEKISVTADPSLVTVKRNPGSLATIEPLPDPTAAIVAPAAG